MHDSHQARHDNALNMRITDTYASYNQIWVVLGDSMGILCKSSQGRQGELEELNEK